MSAPAIRLDDLDRLTGLLPDCIPPRTVAELARAAVEIQRPDVAITLQPGRIEDYQDLTDHLAWLTRRLTAAAAAAGASAERPCRESDARSLTQPKSIETQTRALETETFTPPLEAETRSVAANLTAPVWTDSELAQLVAWRASGKSFAEIGAALGRSAGACRLRLIKVEQQAALKVPTPAKVAPVAVEVEPVCPLGFTPVDAILDALAGLDDSFEPADDKALVDQRSIGIGFPVIAAELGCDEATVLARWRAILGCGVHHKGGIVTEKGWTELRAAVARRAAEAEV